MDERILENFPDILKPEEVQKVLGISRSYIYRLLKSGELKAFKMGKMYRIPKCYLQDYILSGFEG